MHRPLLPIALLAAAAGCHTFQPASVGDVGPGQAVRVRITGAFSDSLTSILPNADTRELEAVVASRDDASLFLDVPVQQSLRGMRFETLNQRVEIPTSAFVELETKQFHTGRTIVAAGVAAAVVGAVLVYQLSKDSGGGNPPGPGGPVESIVSIGISPWALVGLPGR